MLNNHNNAKLLQNYKLKFHVKVSAEPESFVHF